MIRGHGGIAERGVLGATTLQGRTAPTLDEIRTSWPATVDVPQAGRAFGISRSHAYDLVNCGEFPARVIKVGGRYRVVTASIIKALSDDP